MKRLLALFIMAAGPSWADNHDHHMQHSHEGHVHETAVNGEALEVDSKRFDAFISDLSGVQIAVVSVNGMVCDFCARGIEKTFLKDSSVLKIDVDLNQGKVLVAYAQDVVVDFQDIERKILANGQNATGLQVVNL